MLHWNMQLYPHVYLILSGGQGPGEHISESEAMKRFLVKNGIQEERVTS